MNSSTLERNIPVARPFVGREEEEAVLDVLRSGWLTQGPRVAAFEQAFAAYVGAPYAVAVSSCMTALHLALVAAGIKHGDEVLCPSLSFTATANTIVHSGATPIFVDVDQATYNIDPARVEDAITSRTKALVLVHQIGLPAAIDEISHIAKRHSLIVIEDAACAVGSEYKRRRIGSPHSAMACFSFHPRKILTTGEGGMITTADEHTADQLRRLRQHAMTLSDLARHASQTIVTERYDEVGFNYRMTDLQAAIGMVQLRRLDELLATRRRLAERYASRLSSLPWLVLPQETADCRHNYQSYMVRLTSDAPVSRDRLMQALLDRGVSSRRGIMAIHRETPYHSEAWDTLLPVTTLVSDTALILPLFHDMREDDHDHVVDCINHIHARARNASA